MIRRPPRSTLFPYTTRFRSGLKQGWAFAWRSLMAGELLVLTGQLSIGARLQTFRDINFAQGLMAMMLVIRSEEHTSALQSRQYLVCRLLLAKKKNPPNETDS